MLIHAFLLNLCCKELYCRGFYVCHNVCDRPDLADRDMKCRVFSAPVGETGHWYMMSYEKEENPTLTDVDHASMF